MNLRRLIQSFIVSMPLLYSSAFAATDVATIAATNVAAAAAVYKTECGACHVAYPGVFLPQASWNTILSKLDDHFGDNAELDSDALQTIQSYLQIDNYDRSRIRNQTRGRFDMSGTPIRVTDTKLFRAIHGEISASRVKNNPKVKTFARCDACHRGAENGNFSESQVRIPRG